MHCVDITSSGISVKTWILRLIAIHQSRSRVKGPVFVSLKGGQSISAEMNAMFLECLIYLFEENKPSRFGVDVNSSEDIASKYHVFRSFRRGSESRAVAMKVNEADRYVVNRWRKKEATGASRVNHSIGQHYVDITQVSPSFLRYTCNMIGGFDIISVATPESVTKAGTNKNSLERKGQISSRCGGLNSRRGIG